MPHLKSWLIALALTSAVIAQEPYSRLPKNYSLEFENCYVRISRVRYAKGDKLPEHSHPSLPTVYVYLTDGGPIRFTHKNSPFTLVRPAVTAGNVRFNRNASIETHETEYLGDSATEYLRIEMKTTPGPAHRDARLNADTDFPWEDPQVRIRRVRSLTSRLSRPAVVVNQPDRGFTWLDSGKLPAATASRWLVVVELLTEP